MKDNGKKAKNKGLESIHGSMVKHIQGNGKKVKWKDMVNTPGQLGIVIMANGNKTKWKGRALIFIIMEIFIQVH